MGIIIDGYKIFKPDWTCRGKQYTCPGDFVENVKPVVCERGMHFCRKLTDCLFYYPLDYVVPGPNGVRKMRVAKVMTDFDKNAFNFDIAYGHDILSTYIIHKYATSELHILRELTDDEIITTICHEVNHDLYALRALLMKIKAYESVYFKESRSFKLCMILTKMLEQQKGVDD